MKTYKYYDKTWRRYPSATRFGEVVDRLVDDGVASYRSVAHWLDRSWVSLADRPRSSGHYRNCTEAEARALDRFAREWKAANDALTPFKDGTRWQQIMDEEAS